jgi:transposase-like protein
MDKASRRAKRLRRSFTPEFKVEAVRLCQLGDRTIRRIASDLMDLEILKKATELFSRRNL